MPAPSQRSSRLDSGYDLCLAPYRAAWHELVGCFAVALVSTHLSSVIRCALRLGAERSETASRRLPEGRSEAEATNCPSLSRPDSLA